MKCTPGHWVERQSLTWLGLCKFRESHHCHSEWQQRAQDLVLHGTERLCWNCRPSSRTFKTVFKAVRPTVAMF